MMLFTVAFGAALVLNEWKPFWVDEWRIIFNLKFRSVPRLWAQLDYMQQFPRVYLSIIKGFTAPLDYSYSALRLPSFIIGTGLILCTWRLMNRIYPDVAPLKYLFVLLPVCSLTFSGYYVQIKQYTMDMLMSFLAMWQLLQLIRLASGELSRRGYVLQCFMCFLMPFFSYTYPVVIVPAYALVMMRAFRQNAENSRQNMARFALPLVAAMIGNGIFYLVDVRQLMADGGMKMFWGHLMLRDGYSWKALSVAPDLFTKILELSVFNTILGYLALIAFLMRLGLLLFGRQGWDDAPKAIVAYYSVLLISEMLILFLAGKLPLGESRLNAFAIPAISILFIWLLDAGYNRCRKWPADIATCLLLGGVIYAGIHAQLAPFQEERYERKLAVYRATETALREADAKHLPILITPEVAYPWHQSRNFPFYDAIPGDWVLKTLPGYHMRTGLPVINISDMGVADSVFATLPYGAAIAGDGLQYRMLRKR